MLAPIGSGYEVATGEELQDEAADQLSTALGFINTFLLVFAFIALFVGTFIILNTFSMLVARRTKELALLRAIGASKAQITWSVVGEAFLLGLLGGVLGILMGIGVALGLRQLLGVLGAELPAGNLVLAPRTIIIGMPRRGHRHGGGRLVPGPACLAGARRSLPCATRSPCRRKSLRLRAIGGGFVLTGARCAGPGSGGVQRGAGEPTDGCRARSLRAARRGDRARSGVQPSARRVGRVRP